MKGAELNFFKSFRYLTQELLRNFFQNNTWYFRSPITPWRNLSGGRYLELFNSVGSLYSLCKILSSGDHVPTDVCFCTFFYAPKPQKANLTYSALVCPLTFWWKAIFIFFEGLVKVVDHNLLPQGCEIKKVFKRRLSHFLSPCWPRGESLI